MSKENRRKEVQMERRDAPEQNEKKTISAYKQFVKDIRLMVKDSNQTSGSEQSLGVELDVLTSKVRYLLSKEDSEKREKRCEHKSPKEVHSLCREEKERSEKQVKKMKEVIKNLDQEIEMLKEEL